MDMEISTKGESWQNLKSEVSTQRKCIYILLAWKIQLREYVLSTKIHSTKSFPTEPLAKLSKDQKSQVVKGLEKKQQHREKLMTSFDGVKGSQQRPIATCVKGYDSKIM